MRRLATPRAWLAVGAVLLIAGCAADRYPLSGGAPGGAQLSPATVGVPTQAVVSYIEVRPGDRIELIGAEAIGMLDGAPWPCGSLVRSSRRTATT